jgi:hypothetical protein
VARGKVKIASRAEHGYLILEPEENLSAKSDIGELVPLVKRALQKGTMHIAVSLKPGSFLFSKTIGVLVQCAELLRGKGGKLAIVSQSSYLSMCIKSLKLDQLVRLCSSERELNGVEG